MRKILILGVNGFIGSHLVRALCKNSKNKIYGIDIEKHNIIECLKYKNFFFYNKDVNHNDNWIEKKIKECEIIIPLIAIATPNVYVKEPLRVFQLDFESNLKIVKLVAKYKKRLIFPSTSEVYGISNDANFKEYKTNLVVGPVHKSRWIYSASKQLLDRLIFAYGFEKALNFTIFRPFNWIGPRLDSLEKTQLGNGRVLSIFMNNILNKKKILLVNGGFQKRSFTYIDDGISALTKIINSNKNKFNGKIFNIGNPKNNISIKNLAVVLIEEYNKISKKKYLLKVSSIEEKKFYGKGYEDIKVRVPSINEAKKYLNWKPKIGFRLAIQKTIKHYILN